MRVKTNFCIGGAYNPNTKNKGLQIKRMLRKKELGARYFLTQPVYTKEKIDEVAELTREVDASVFLGIMPLASYRNAQFLHNEFPGISIPEDIRERMKAAGKAGLAAGTEIAWELVKYAWPKFDGVYIIPPFNKYPVAVDLIGRIKEMEKEQ